MGRSLLGAQETALTFAVSRSLGVTSRVRIQVLAFAVALSIGVCSLLKLQIESTPRVTLGSNIADLRKSCGEPAVKLRQVELSKSAASGFVYQEQSVSGKLSGKNLKASQLPKIPHEAWYYPYGVLGTTCALVYVSREGEVLRIFFGGT